LSAPAIDLARTNIRPPGNLRDHRSRRQALGNNRPLLLGAPPTPPFRPANDFKPRHRTVSSTSANTVTCTTAYQPDPPPRRKAAFTGRVRLAGESARTEPSLKSLSSSARSSASSNCGATASHYERSQQPLPLTALGCRMRG